MALPNTPQAVDDVASTNEDTAIDVNALANDLGGNAKHLYSLDQSGSSVVTSATTADGATITMNGDGTIHYDPTHVSAIDALQQGQTLDDTFHYTIQMGNGDTSTATVTVHVAGVNDPPVAHDDAGFSTLNTQPLTIQAPQLLANDTDPEHDTLSITAVGHASDGTATLNQDGSVTFTPQAGYVGQAGFQYTLSDGHGGTATANVGVTVNPGNDPPVATDDSYSLPHQSLTLDSSHLGPAEDATGQTRDPDQTLTVDAAHGVLANDTHDYPVTATLQEGPSHGSLDFHSDGSFSYTPDFRYAGTDSFTYQIADNGGSGKTGNTATVHLTTDAVDVTINGTSGSEHLWGGPGNDVILGNGGGDLLSGQGGNDVIDPGTGAANASGGGYTYIYGDGGADTFRFDNGNHSNFVIEDWNPAEGDKIELHGFGGQAPTLYPYVGANQVGIALPDGGFGYVIGTEHVDPSSFVYT
jgi:VCBS repeat-containing protein